MSVVRLRFLIRPREECNQTDLQVLSVYRDHGVVPKNSRSDNFNKTPEDISRYQEVRVGDLVVNKMKAWQGSLGVSTHHGIVSPDYLVCSIGPNVDARFLHHLLRSMPLVAEFGARSKGIRPAQWRLYWEDLADISVTLPPLDEQRRIANFLDGEMALIDRLVDAMSRSLYLLQAKRRALLMTAFPDRGFTRVRLGYRLDLVTSGPRGWGEYVGSGGIPFFRSANLRRDSIEPNLEALALVDPPPTASAEALRSRVRIGDVLIGITGANTGWVALVDQRIASANVSQHVCLVRPGKAIDGRWLAHMLSAPQVQELLLASQYGGTKTQLSLSDIRDLVVPLPSIGDQRRIAAGIESGLAEIEAERAPRDRQLVLLAERRRSLVTAAVTGQFDVATARGLSSSGGDFV
jgi:type I restriction enzyme, S subunit